MGFKSRAKKLKHAADAARPPKEDSEDDNEGVTPCDVRSCKNWADKSMGGRRLALDRAADVWGEDGLASDGRRLSVCKQCYREWKKAKKDDPDEWS